MPRINNNTVTTKRARSRRNTDGCDDPDFMPKKKRGDNIITPQKVTRFSISPSRNLPPSLKSPGIVLTPPTKSIGVQVDTPPPGVVIKQEFPVGCIVAINGYDMDNGRWAKRSSAPTFYGCIEDPKDFDEARDMPEGEAFVSFVIAGDYEWLDKNGPNMLQSKYHHKTLMHMADAPVDMIEREGLNQDNFIRWFEKTGKGWRVKHHEDPCYGCGSPWCLVHEDRKGVKKLIEDIGACTRSTPNAKRYRCYREVIARKYGTLGYQQRKSTGWCFETKARSAFPEPSFTGFKIAETGSEGEPEYEKLFQF